MERCGYDLDLSDGGIVCSWNCHRPGIPCSSWLTLLTAGEVAIQARAAINALRTALDCNDRFYQWVSGRRRGVRLNVCGAITVLTKPELAYSARPPSLV